MTDDKLLANRCPHLIKEWHPTLNGAKTPYNVSYGSGYKAWWICIYEDPKLKKVFTFVWQAAVYHRTAGEGCPYLSGKKVYQGFNDLGTVCEELAWQVHPTKNAGRSAADIFAHSNKLIWWLYPYDDPRTGKHFDFEWQASPASRLNSKGCPFLSNQRCWSGYNDLKTRYPLLAAQWDYKRNVKGSEEYMPNSRQEVWWLYPYDDPKTGKHFDFSWKARITNRVQDNGGCPYLSGNLVWEGYNDIASQREDLVEEWDYEKNDKITPQQVSLYSNKKRWWKCRCCGKSLYISPAKRTIGQNCSCRK